MIRAFVESAESGSPVFITDVRSAFTGLADRTALECLLALPDGEHTKHFSIPLPSQGPSDSRETRFIRDYVEADIYNHLTTLGGLRLEIYADRTIGWLWELASRIPAAFGLDAPRSDRSGYGRILNVADRMLNALYPTDTGDGPRRFEIEIKPATGFPGAPAAHQFSAPASAVFTDVVKGLEDRIICGLDIGGTDIKAAVAVRGELSALKEYDWNPAAYGRAEELIDPIIAIVKLLRAKVSLPDGTSPDTAAEVESAMGKNATLEEIERAVRSAESALGEKLCSLDAIGLCFPDVVVKNKIVGGEVPKTKGMRDNTSLDFEEQFAKITDLDRILRNLCRDGGVVMNTNDGPMASFTAAVELAASPDAGQVAAGVFAHTLGTDLGTGLVLGDGTIPEIPLEAYNMIIDLGNYPARSLPAEDARSLNNTNTGLPGTLQRYTSQTGAFRLAVENFPHSRPDLIEEIHRLGYLIAQPESGEDRYIVPESPDDMRKPLLAHLMELTVREHDEPTEKVFRDIGEFLALVWRETEHILQTGINRRFLFGRLVKVSRCFELMQEGAARREADLVLTAADSEMAFTPLMKALDADPDYTVAQFGQAVGAIYFGNLGLIY